MHYTIKHSFFLKRVCSFYSAKGIYIFQIKILAFLFLFFGVHEYFLSGVQQDQGGIFVVVSFVLCSVLFKVLNESQ